MARSADTRQWRGSRSLESCHRGLVEEAVLVADDTTARKANATFTSDDCIRPSGCAKKHEGITAIILSGVLGLLKAFVAYGQAILKPIE